MKLNGQSSDGILVAMCLACIYTSWRGAAFQSVGQKPCPGRRTVACALLLESSLAPASAADSFVTVSLCTADGYELLAKAPSNWGGTTVANPDVLGQWNLDPGYFRDANIAVADIKLDDTVIACKPMPLIPQDLAMCSRPVQARGLQAFADAQLDCLVAEFSPDTCVTLLAKNGALAAGKAVTLALAGSLVPPEEDLPTTPGYSLIAAIIAADFKNDVATRVFVVKALGPVAFMQRNSDDIMAFINSLSSSCR